MKNSIVKLADYPVLAELAKQVTTAKRLDERACRYLYESQLDAIDRSALSPEERALMTKLGVLPTGAGKVRT